MNYRKRSLVSEKSKLRYISITYPKPGDIGVITIAYVITIGLAVSYRTIHLSRLLTYVNYNRSNTITDVNGRIGTDKRPGTTRVPYTGNRRVTRFDRISKTLTSFARGEGASGHGRPKPSTTLSSVDRPLNARTAAQMIHCTVCLFLFTILSEKNVITRHSNK